MKPKKSYGLDESSPTKDEPGRNNILDEPGPGLTDPNVNEVNQLATDPEIKDFKFTARLLKRKKKEK